MKTITVRNCVIDNGMPKIIVPIVGKTEEEILAQACSLSETAADLVELRIDWLPQGGESEFVIGLLKKMHEVMREMPVLVTFRRKVEGGEQEITVECYAKLLKEIAESRTADMLDIELSAGNEVVERIIGVCRANGVVTVVSSHNFNETPAKNVMYDILSEMVKVGADIPKIAVMPRETADVISLLDVSQQFSREQACPIITISMGKLGLISRVSGEYFGSALTFGCGEQPSAPGQLESNKLKELLELFHNNLQME